MFSQTELEALVLGARIVASWADPELGRAAHDVLAQVEAVGPDLDAGTDRRLDKAPAGLVVGLRDALVEAEARRQLGLHPADSGLVAVPHVRRLGAPLEELVLLRLAVQRRIERAADGQRPRVRNVGV